MILFSDILTPLPGMGIDFDIIESKGPQIGDPIRSMAQVDALRPLNPAESMPFVGEVLGRLRQSVGNEAAVLGFVGALTLAAYVVEGKSSKNYAVIKAMAFREPDILHKLLDHFAESIANYLRYQIDSGAQVVQMFDSWAGQLSPCGLRHLRSALSEEGGGSGQADPSRHSFHPLYLRQCRGDRAHGHDRGRHCLPRLDRGHG